MQHILLSFILGDATPVKKVYHNEMESTSWQRRSEAVKSIALPGNGMAYGAMERRGGAMQRKRKDQSCSARQCNGMAQSEMQGE